MVKKRINFIKLFLQYLQTSGEIAYLIITFESGSGASLLPLLKRHRYLL